MGKLRAELVERVHMHPRTTAQWPLTTSPHAVASAQLFVPYVQIDAAASGAAVVRQPVLSLIHVLFDVLCWTLGCIMYNTHIIHNTYYWCIMYCETLVKISESGSNVRLNL